VRLGATVIEILKSFEQAASRFHPAVLMAPGVALMVLGLVAWLGGMYLRRLTLAVAGAVAGGLVGLLVSGTNPSVAGAAAAGGAVFGAFLPRLAPAVLLAALGMAVVFAATTPAPAAAAPRMLFGKPNLGHTQERLTIRQSLDVMQSYTLDLTDYVKAAARPLKTAALAILAAAGLVLLVVGLCLKRLAGAVVAATLGTGLILAGMIALLILKGSTPIALMQQRGALYGLVLLGMAAAGTLEQLVLCPAPRRPEDETRESRGRQKEPGRQWRNR